MFACGKWPVPFEGRVTIYWGAQCGEPHNVAEGFSSTAHFDAAATGVGWTDLADGPSRRTAMLIPNGMILKADVDASDVVFYSEGALKGVPGVYARHDFASEKQLALQAWADHIVELVNPTGKMNVVKFSAA